MLAELEDTTISLNSSRHDSASCHQRALPKIYLPSFSGKYNECTTFRDLFQSLVGDNTQLAAVKKLHYLKGCVSGEAAKAICNIPVTEHNYTRAWKKCVIKDDLQCVH